MAGASQKDASRIYLVGDLYNKVSALDEFSRCMDPQFKNIKNWEHFASALDVPADVIRTCKLCMESESPTIRLFKYLEITRPDMTVGDLRAALTRNPQRARHDLDRMLEDAKLANECKVYKGITNSTSEILDQIALKLDSATPATCNWKSLGRELRIAQEDLQQFEVYTNYNPTETLFRRLYTSNPNTVKASVIVGYLEQMKRRDILEEIRHNIPDLASKDAQDIFKLGSELLDRTSRRLNEDRPGVKGWRGLARHLMADNYIDDADIISKLEPPRQQEIHSPTKKIIEWLTANKPDVTIDDLIAKCEEINRNDAVMILVGHYSRAVEQSFEIMRDTPSEIRLRGPTAIKAYEKALLDGETKNRRLFLMLIGQSRAGKTSLLKSFRGEVFDPNQDSTECAVLHRHCCKLVETVWVQDSAIEDQISFEGAMSKNIAKNYQAEQTSHRDVEINHTSLDVIDNRDDDSKKMDNSAEFDDATALQHVSAKPNDSLQNPKDVEGPLSFVNRVETQNEVIKRANDNLGNLEEAESDDIICTALDIGGQRVYDVTHPLFISSKGVFILVHSLKNAACNVAAPLAKKGSVKRKLDDKCSMTNMDHLEFWMSFVDMNTDLDAFPENALLPDKLPPVFLACTHADKPCEGQNAKEMSREILKYLERKEHPPGKHLVSSLYLIDNTVSGSFEDEGVKRLRKDICDVAKSLPHMNEDIPIRWMAFEKELLSLVQKEKRFLSIEETRKIAFDCKVNVESDEFITVVNYLHDIREIVYFEDTRTVFIDVQWLINMIRKVITVEPREKWQKEHKDSWTRLEEEGVLDWSLLEHVWSDELADDQATIGSLLLIMERFSLVCRWKTTGEQDVFLVPAMLWNSSAQDVAELLKDQMTPLIVHFPSSHLPLGIFSRLQVMFAEYCNRTWTRTRQPKFYHNFCRFFNVGEDASFDLVMTSDIRTISIGIINVKKADRQKIRKFSQTILEFLKTKLDEDMRTNFPWMKRMDYKLCIRCPICQPSADCSLPHCPGCTRDSCVHFISEEEVLKEEDLRCEKSPTSKNTDIPYEYYSHWFPKPEKEKSSISGGLSMDEENKRWVVVGLALMKDLLPALRRYVLPKITKHYNDLKARHNIDTQVHGAHLEMDGTFRLNYVSINTKQGKNPKLFDYKVTSEVDLAKLYLLPSMAKFTGIDESCDLSAVLGMLCSASVFTVATQDAAKVVRRNVRNKWGHCNFTEWDETKFLDCFQLMDDLVKTLNLADDQEKKLLRQLKEWKEKGVQLCLGCPVDADLLKLVQNDVAWLIEEVQYLKEGDREQLEEFERVTDALKEFKTHVSKRLQELETRVTAVECRVKALEDVNNA